MAKTIEEEGKSVLLVNFTKLHAFLWDRVVSQKSNTSRLLSLDISLNVVSKEHLNALIYSGPEAHKHIYLYHSDDHYDVITSMPAFLARKQYCHQCKKGFDKITDHPCGDLCELCHTQGCPIVEWVHCKDCHRYYKSRECFDRHKNEDGPANSICQALLKCHQCHRVVTRASMNNHHCGKVKCSICKTHVSPEGHQCFLPPIETRQPRQNRRRNELVDDDVEVEDEVGERESNLMFFDFECTQDDGVHVPNLCVVQNESGDETTFVII